MSDSDAPENWTYPLKHYLHTVWLPTFRAAVPPLDASGRAQPWPPLEDLRRRPGTRRLGAVTRMDYAALAHETINYFAALPATPIDGASAAALSLPNPDLVHVDAHDRRRLARIDTPGLFRELVQTHVLDTLSEALRLVHRLPADAPLARALRFRETPQFCSVWRSKWDVLYLPGSTPGGFAVAVVCLPPWDFGFVDFDDFVRAQTFPTGHIDTLDNVPFTQPCFKLWAALYDVCGGRGHYFAVTTYDRWAFGRFNDDWSAVQLTHTLTSPVRTFSGKALPGTDNVDADSRLEDEPNLMEVVVFWIQVARGAANVGSLDGVLEVGRGGVCL